MRRILAGVSTEKVKIIKPDQSVIENVDALVQREKIFVDDGTLNIEEGDIIERTLPSGSKEKYLVEDRGFFREMNGIASHYQIKVKKQNPIQNPILDVLLITTILQMRKRLILIPRTIQ